MAEYAARERVRLLVENEGSCNVATCSELSALMSEMQQDSLGINWDPHNGFALGAALLRLRLEHDLSMG
jgi:hypothetical protein